MKHGKLQSLLILVVAAFPALAHAQIKQLSLKECLQTALENNYALQIVKNETEIAANNYTKANAGLLPTVDASARYAGGLSNYGSTDFANVKSSTDFRVANSASASVDASWDLFSGFKAQSQYARLRELKEVGDLKTRLAIEGLISNVVSEYYRLVQQVQHKQNLEFILSVSRERLYIVDINYELGSRSRPELLQAKVDFNSDSSALVKHKQDILASQIKLRTLMGNLSAERFAPDSLIVLLPELPLAELLEQTLNENTELLIAAKQTEISEYDIKIMRANTLPYLRLNSGYNFAYNRYSAGATKRSYDNGLTYGFTLGINLFDGGNRKREVQNARIEKRNRELAQRELALNVEARFREIYSSYVNNLELLRVERQNLKTAMENFEVAEERYRLGELAGIDMREAQNSFQDAEKRLLDVEYNAKMDEISLMMLSGNISDYFVR